MPRPAPAAPAASEAKVQRLLDRVRRLYALGQQANGPAAITVSQLVELNGLGESSIRRAKAFARDYTPAELDQFCQCRRPNDLPLHWGHIIWLLTVKDRGERRRWELKAARQGWTASDLRVQLHQSRQPNPSAHGGRVRKPASLESALLQLIHEGNRWADRCNLLLADDVPTGGGTAALNKLIAEARSTLGRVKTAAGKTMQRLSGGGGRRRKRGR